MRRGRAESLNLPVDPGSLLKGRIVDNLRRLVGPDENQSELARRIGVKSPSYINNVLAGRTGVSINKVEVFARMLEVDPGVFFLPVEESKYFQDILKKKSK